MWSIVDVARMAGVTARTPRRHGRHAAPRRAGTGGGGPDAIGLLPPAGTAGNGYREYGREELLRLQRILVLRALGLPLAEIAAVLDEHRDAVEALTAHHERLVAERDRLARIAETVARTIEDLRGEGGAAMAPENLFEGFDAARYEEEARRRWPEEAASSAAYTATLTADDQRRLQEEWTARLQRLAGLRSTGAAVDAPEVQAVIDELYRGLLPMWTPDAAAFRGLGATYVDDERFRATFDRVSPGLAEYVRDAMGVYADTRLA